MMVFLLILGIVLAVSTFCSFSLSLFVLWAAFNTHDGSAGLYGSQLSFSLICFIIGLVLLGLTIYCFMKRKKLKKKDD